jgi:hypothetical protein
MAIWCKNGVSKVTASSGNKREFVECLYLVLARRRMGLRHARAGRQEPGTRRCRHRLPISGTTELESSCGEWKMEGHYGHQENRGRAGAVEQRQCTVWDG